MEISAVKTLDRFVEIMDCFAHERPAWSLADLSARLHLPKSTLHRFLIALEVHGLLRRDPSDARWRLGYRLVRWGELAAESTPLRDLARSAMVELTELTGETTILTVYHQGEVTCIAMCETHHPVRLRMAVGTRRAVHAGASSKVLMAYLPDQEIASLIRERGLPRICTNTITDPAAMWAELTLIRERGYADSLEETDPAAWGVATPVRDWRGRVVAGIGVAGPTTRFNPERVRHLAALCGQAAAKISAQLGR
jgi:DNA-binding IclR family transcriptional regulator